MQFHYNICFTRAKGMHINKDKDPDVHIWILVPITNAGCSACGPSRPLSGHLQPPLLYSLLEVSESVIRRYGFLLKAGQIQSKEGTVEEKIRRFCGVHPRPRIRQKRNTMIV